MKQAKEFHWPILGHSQIKKYLQACLLSKTISHAYLFYGPAHVGKLLTASQLTASLLCTAADGERPCQHCASCEALAKNAHADVAIIKKETGKDHITINQIRELQHKLSLRSFLMNYKIAIIDEAETMTEEAANALLKTLEEPTPQTIFMLVSEKKEALPTTIVSRCQGLQFNLVSAEQIEDWLKERYPEKDTIKLIAHLAGGKPGLAQLYMATETLLEERWQFADYFTEMMRANYQGRFNIIAAILKDAEEEDAYLFHLLDNWLSCVRDILLIRQVAGAYVINTPLKNTFYTLAQQYTTGALLRIIKNLDSAKKMLTQSISPRLALENLALSI